MENKQLGWALRLVRKLNEHSLAQAATLTGIERSRLSAMERGLRMEVKLIRKFETRYDLPRNQIKNLSSLADTGTPELVTKLVAKKPYISLVGNVIGKSINVVTKIKNSLPFSYQFGW